MLTLALFQQDDPVAGLRSPLVGVVTLVALVAVIVALLRNR